MELQTCSYEIFKIKQEAEKEGLLVSTSNILERNRTELNDKLSTYFRSKYKLKSYYTEDEGEDVLDNLSSYLDSIGFDEYLDYPYDGEESLYIIPITENLSLYVEAYDEYYGSGGYSKGVNIDRFIINENTTKEDVDKLIEILKQYNIK